MRSLVISLLIPIITLPTAAMAQDSPPAFVPTGAEVQAPRGYTEMCADDPALCRRFRPQPETVAPPAKDDGFLRLPAPRPVAWGQPFAQIAPGLPDVIEVAHAKPSSTGNTALSQIALAALRPFHAPASTPVAPAPDMRLAALLGQPTAAVALPPLPSRAPQETDASDTSPPDERALLRLVHTINAHVNRRVFQQTDQRIYGRPEVWRPAGDKPGAMGDCEDIALEKRLELLAAHFPAERLFMAVVFSRTAGLHAVLVARMTDGDIVLDSRVNYITPWANSGYEWLSVESPQDPDHWYAVNTSS